MIKRNYEECRGTFKNGRWELKNLKFLEEFMFQLNLTTGDVARALGVTRNAVTRWFIFDNTSVRNVMKVADCYGYDLGISYMGLPPKETEIENTTLIIENVATKRVQDIDLTKRLAFIRVAMASYGKTLEDVAAALQVRRDAVQKIFQIDDTSFFNIYQIAETFGWHVFITFKEKKSSEPKLETNAKAVKPVAEKVSK